MMDTYSSLHCYDPVTRRWSKRANMKTKRTGFSLVPIGGKLYAIGGLDYKQGNLFREVNLCFYLINIHNLLSVKNVSKDTVISLLCTCTIYGNIDRYLIV